jgi:MFS family permease
MIPGSLLFPARFLTMAHRPMPAPTPPDAADPNTAAPALLRALDDVIRPGGRVFYGWWIVLASAGVQLLGGALWSQATGAYMVLMQAEFGWSATVVSLAFALTRVESGLLGPLQGWMADRFGPRAILQLGTVIFGVGCMMFSQVDSLLSFFLIFALIAIGSSLGGFATLMVSLVHWFDRHRSKAVSISQIGYSVGGLCLPAVVWSLETYGWRNTAFASGVIILLLGLPIGHVVRHRPEDRGDVPDGRVRTEVELAAAPHVSDGSRDFTAGEAARTPAFWLISLGHALALLIVSAVMLHLVPHLTRGLGYSLTAAGGVVALMTAFQIAGQLAGGMLGDRFDKRWICAVCMLAHAGGLLCVTYATSFAMVFAFAALHGLAWGIRGPLIVAIRADYFGATAFGAIMGWSSLIAMFGMSGGPIVVGVMHDAMGDYVGGFALLAVLSLAGVACFLGARQPARPQASM